MKKFLVGLVAAIVCVGMSACAPFNLDMAEKKMEKAGYEVIIYNEEEAEGKLSLEIDGLVGAMYATKSGGVLGLTDMKMLIAAYFETVADAKDFYEDIENDSSKREGRWVYWGHDEAIEEFTKLF